MLVKKKKLPVSPWRKVIKMELLVKGSRVKGTPKSNPNALHFIYNVLESIKMMAEIERSMIFQMQLLHLFLRYSMMGIENATAKEAD